MNGGTRTNVSADISWDTYWQGTATSAAFSAGGKSHPVIDEFWKDFFAHATQNRSGIRCIDIASGGGAVVEHMRATFGTDSVDICCLDASKAAIASLQARFPGVSGIVADAAHIPLGSSSFNVVTSQFGIEYAGGPAIAEAARLVGSSGYLAFILHHTGGIIYSDCTASLDAVQQTLQCRFIPLAIQFFNAGFVACRGGSRTAYDTAGTALSPAVRVLENIMHVHGNGVAGGVIARLYRDVGKIHSSVQHYEPAEVVAWLQGTEIELNAYAARMGSMCASALDGEGMRRVTTTLVQGGLEIQRAGDLVGPVQGRPLAWVVVATR